MILKNDITNLKTDIEEKIGQKIIVQETRKRNQPFKKEGTIDRIYPNFFSVKYEENEINGTCTCKYTDVLSGSIEIQVFNGEVYSPLTPELVREGKY